MYIIIYDITYNIVELNSLGFVFEMEEFISFIYLFIFNLLNII